MNMQEITKAIVNNAKSKQWLSCHFDLEQDGVQYRLGVKAFGRWVQRLEINGIVSNVPEQKTNKRLAELLLLEISCLIQSNGGKL